MNRAVYEANRKSQFLSGIMQPLMNVIGNLAMSPCACWALHS